MFKKKKAWANNLKYRNDLNIYVEKKAYKKL